MSLKENQEEISLNPKFLFQVDGGDLLSRVSTLVEENSSFNSTDKLPFLDDSDSENNDALQSESEGSDTEDEKESRDDDSDSDSELSGMEPIDENQDTVKDKRIVSDYFEEAPPSSNTIDSFTQLNLSRPLLKAISQLGYTKPTEIQSRAIPLGLQGKDLCGAAVTGSGKTAAFMIPILERLIHRPKSIPATRVLIIIPTRELAQQILEVTKSLALYTDITCCLCVGGLSSKTQEFELRKRPDIVIATPGRLIDHLKNTPSFNLDSVDVLVMDEADRILEDGFKDELNEIIKSCPHGRQTMLFSATMTENIDDLIRLSLDKPIKLFVDSNTTISKKIVQEFIRIRDPSTKPAMLLALVRTYPKETIIFFKSKVQTHYFTALFNLLELNAVELHGDLNQQERTASLEKFKSKQANFLLCTDLASRGIDVPNVKTVINFDMPNQFSHYVHRCGRTARAGMKGIAASFVEESDRKIMKTVVKSVSGDVKQRILNKNVVSVFEEQLPKLTIQLKKILEREKEVRQIEKEEMKLSKLENMVEYEKEIQSRPKREWFQTEKDKEESRQISSKNHMDRMGIKVPKTSKPGLSSFAPKRNKLDGKSRKQKRNFMARTEDKRELAKQKISAKSKKSQNRPTKIRKMN